MDLIETFKIIRSLSPAELEREVNGHRRLGWCLHGILFQDPRSGEFIQAVKRPCPRHLRQQHEGEQSVMLFQHLLSAGASSDTTN